MGRYTDDLLRRNRTARLGKAKLQSAERLVSCAIQTKGGVKHGFRSHSELRRSMNVEDPYNTIPGTIDGFWTSADRFVGRREAQYVALEAGQIGRVQARDLLSSDINW